MKSMKNRLPKPSTRVPRTIREEFDTLLWCKRAQEELSEMNSVRSQQLISAIGLFLGTPSHCEGTSQNNLVDDQAGNDEDTSENPKVPWYHQFVFPEGMANWISNVKVCDLLFGIAITVIIYLLVR